MGLKPKKARGAVALAMAAIALTASAASAEPNDRTWYVRAGADGDGSRRAPFGSLAAAEEASRRGDRIIVRRSSDVLDGGIVLKRGQHLVGRKKPQIADADGDAVVLASRTRVRGLRIVAAARGGIYGENVSRVLIKNNDVSGHNTSCTPGFHIPPFEVPTTLPDIGIPIGEGLLNGWAGIMVDADRGTRRIAITGNRVHDAECGDGIDVRAFESARVRARIAKNDVSDLRQGPNLESVLAIGVQASDGAKVRAKITRNSESGLGNDEDAGVGPEGADSEGVFINPVGPSIVRARVNRNTYTHVAGRGGFSANGLEFVTMGDGARGYVSVRNSEFSETPGDVLEQLALGTNGTLRLKLANVEATGSTGAAGSGFGNTFIIPGNNGDCLLSASGGAGNVVTLDARDVTLTDCANNGLTFGSSVANGSGPTRRLRMSLEDSTLTGNQGNNLRIGNVSELDNLKVLVEDSNLSDAEGLASITPANASFEDLGSTTAGAIDLGGGTLGSAGRNCLDGGILGAALLNYDVTAESNYWGPAVLALPIGGTLDSDPTLAQPPPHCN
ncbi:MAG: hypothetical protein QOI31_1973 [Solirubrobacterales bacterium]|jgi:hypothetical protein|nr:hypothetical protein [Solirubrobacterales bacterium]